jgi:hypothetical protein
MGMGLALAAALALSPSPAYAYQGDPWDDLPNSDWDQCQVNGTTDYGAEVCAVASVDNRGDVGGVEHYQVVLGLWDTAADGKCAHAVWQRTYQDGYVETHYGMYTCGLNSYWSAIFQNYSTWGHGYVVKERIGCFVDNGSVWWAWLYPW